MKCFLQIIYDREGVKKILSFIFISVYMCVLACLYVCYVCVESVGNLKRESDPLELELAACEWSDVGARIETTPTARAARALKG